MTKVKLLLIGRQRGEDGDESVARTNTTAEYSCPEQRPNSAQSFYILYNELQEDTGISCKNIIKLKGSTLELTKRNTEDATLTRMVFEPGKAHKVNYVTPFGCLQMEVFTQSLDVSFSDCLPQIQLKYTLTSAGRLLSHCQLTVNLEPL